MYIIIARTVLATQCVSVTRTYHMSAAGLGFEPRYTVPETVVLPLDDPAITSSYYHKMTEKQLKNG